VQTSCSMRSSASAGAWPTNQLSVTPCGLGMVVLAHPS
jgi:hypothetical protein